MQFYYAAGIVGMSVVIYVRIDWDGSKAAAAAVSAPAHHPSHACCCCGTPLIGWPHALLAVQAAVRATKLKHGIALDE